MQNTIKPEIFETACAVFTASETQSHIYTTLGRIYGTQFFAEVPTASDLVIVTRNAFLEIVSEMTNPFARPITIRDIITKIEDVLGLGESYALLAMEGQINA